MKLSDKFDAAAAACGFSFLVSMATVIFSDGILQLAAAGGAVASAAMGFWLWAKGVDAGQREYLNILSKNPQRAWD